MKLMIAEDADRMCAFAAHFVVRRIQANPALVLGLATGRTMIPFYAHLVARFRAGDCSFAGVTTFNLDEFVGIPTSHPGSYANYMRRHLFDFVDIDRTRTHLPDGNAPDMVAGTEAYERLIREAGGIDLQMLGIGGNGHLAFNEPGSSLASRTRVKRLEIETIRANCEDFGGVDGVPRYVVTTGIGTIMDARFVMLLAGGEGKAEAIASLAEGPITARWPASVLQMHPHAFVVADRMAAARLARRYDTVDEALADPFEEYFWEGA